MKDDRQKAKSWVALITLALLRQAERDGVLGAVAYCLPLNDAANCPSTSVGNKSAPAVDNKSARVVDSKSAPAVDNFAPVVGSTSAVAVDRNGTDRPANSRLIDSRRRARGRSVPSIEKPNSSCSL